MKNFTDDKTKTDRKGGPDSKGRPSITAHPAFPLIVAGWFAALFGIATLVLPLGPLESVISITHLDSLLSFLAPPLGTKARIILALLGAGIGATMGGAIARRVVEFQTKGVAIDPFARGQRNKVSPIDVRGEVPLEGILPEEDPARLDNPYDGDESAPLFGGFEDDEDETDTHPGHSDPATARAGARALDPQIFDVTEAQIYVDAEEFAAADNEMPSIEASEPEPVAEPVVEVAPPSATLPDAEATAGTNPFSHQEPAELRSADIDPQAPVPGFSAPAVEQTDDPLPEIAWLIDAADSVPSTPATPTVQWAEDWTEEPSDDAAFADGENSFEAWSAPLGDTDPPAEDHAEDETFVDALPEADSSGLTAAAPRDVVDSDAASGEMHALVGRLQVTLERYQTFKAARANRLSATAAFPRAVDFPHSAPLEAMPATEAPEPLAVPVWESQPVPEVTAPQSPLAQQPAPPLSGINISFSDASDDVVDELAAVAFNNPPQLPEPDVDVAAPGDEIEPEASDEQPQLPSPEPRARPFNTVLDPLDELSAFLVPVPEVRGEPDLIAEPTAPETRAEVGEKLAAAEPATAQTDCEVHADSIGHDVHEDDEFLAEGWQPRAPFSAFEEAESGDQDEPEPSLYPETSEPTLAAFDAPAETDAQDHENGAFETPEIEPAEEPALRPPPFIDLTAGIEDVDMLEEEFEALTASLSLPLADRAPPRVDFISSAEDLLADCEDEYDEEDEEAEDESAFSSLLTMRSKYGETLSAEGEIEPDLEGELEDLAMPALPKEYDPTPSTAQPRAPKVQALPERPSAAEMDSEYEFAAAPLPEPLPDAASSPPPAPVPLQMVRNEDMPAPPPTQPPSVGSGSILAAKPVRPRENSHERQAALRDALQHLQRMSGAA